MYSTPTPDPDKFTLFSTPDPSNKLNNLDNNLVKLIFTNLLLIE